MFVPAPLFAAVSGHERALGRVGVKLDRPYEHPMSQKTSSEKTSTDSPTPETAAAPKSSSFRYFQRRPPKERAQSGRILPPPPAWMMKPLKPPGVGGSDSR